MLHQIVMYLFTVFLLFSPQTLIEAGNQTPNDSECILTDVKSHLSIASQIIDTAKEKIPKSKMDAEAGDETANYGCILTEIKSHLNIASQIMKTANQKIPKDLKELCKEFKGDDCKNVTYNSKPQDCSDILLNGERRNGLYNVWPQSKMFKGSLRVYCDMESDGGGWTVIQRRGDYGSPQDYFFRDWNAYKIGFGDRLKDFWIGNDNLFALTNQRHYQLRVNLTAWDGDSAYAIYDEFWTSDEFQNYTLHVNGYNGTAGNSLQVSKRPQFSTKDRNNNWGSTNCAELYKGAWWYPDCGYSSLNGLYLPAKDVTKHDGVVWYHFKRTYHSLKDSVMKIRPAYFTDSSNRSD